MRRAAWELSSEHVIWMDGLWPGMERGYEKGVCARSGFYYDFPALTRPRDSFYVLAITSRSDL